MVIWGRYLDAHIWEGWGGSHFWIYFFFSLFLRDYKNCEGGGEGTSDLGIKNLPLMRDNHTKNGTLGLKQNQSDEIVSYHISGIKRPTFIYIFTYVGSVQLELDYWCKSRPKWASSRQTYALRMLPPMDGGVGHDIGNMSLMQIDYSTRIGSLNKHSTISASCQLYENTIFVKIPLTTC